MLIVKDEKIFKEQCEKVSENNEERQALLSGKCSKAMVNGAGFRAVRSVQGTDPCLLRASRQNQHFTVGKKQTARRRTLGQPSVQTESVDPYFNLCNKIPVVSKVKKKKKIQVQEAPLDKAFKNFTMRNHLEYIKPRKP